MASTNGVQPPPAAGVYAGSRPPTSWANAGAAAAVLWKKEFNNSDSYMRTLGFTKANSGYRRLLNHSGVTRQLAWLYKTKFATFLECEFVT